MKPKIVAIIPIRKNSRRIKNKNFINFYKGNSLLEIKIKQLKKINKIDKIIVSSDSVLTRKLHINITYLFIKEKSILLALFVLAVTFFKI